MASDFQTNLQPHYVQMSKDKRDSRIVFLTFPL